MKAYASPEDWLADAEPWQVPLIEAMRRAILAAADFEQTIKWGNLFFLHRGPCILIRHEPERVLLGFMRGKRLVAREPRLKPGGRYELANLVLRPGSVEPPATLGELAAEAAALNDRLGDPTCRERA